MIPASIMSSLETIGEEQILAAQGEQEIARLIAQRVASAFRRLRRRVDVSPLGWNRAH
jgi:hypothetical protein